MEIKSQRGQSTVEYILLLAVLIILLTAVLRNRRFQDYVGTDGKFFRDYARRIGYTYRHGHSGGRPGNAPPPQNDYTSTHDTYKRRGGSASRFVIPLGEYPKN
ncbi:MAG: hypothetical protein OXB88_00680 [Bacteriovoracales bacterium]|nr:hypothetical protein [Bacteriovoracales bacterium]